MPSFDVVNELDLQEIDNAINQAIKEVSQRYDFRNAVPEIELNKKDKKLKVVVADEMKLRAVKEIINARLISRKVSIKVIDWGTQDKASLGAIRIEAKLVEGLDVDTARRIVKLIKDSKLKVQAAIEGPKVRVTGKNIDDLQAVIAMCRDLSDLPVPLQYVNMKK